MLHHHRQHLSPRPLAQVARSVFITDGTLERGGDQVIPSRSPSRQPALRTAHEQALERSRLHAPGVFLVYAADNALRPRACTFRVWRAQIALEQPLPQIS